MIIDCEDNPDDLISQIGDRYFSICDEDMDEFYRHPDHPNTIRIIDCEDGIHIDIWTEYGPEHTRQSAKALLILLNQDYKNVKDDN